MSTGTREDRGQDKWAKERRELERYGGFEETRNRSTWEGFCGVYQSIEPKRQEITVGHAYTAQRLKQRRR